jgi:hypothetical protein
MRDKGVTMTMTTSTNGAAPLASQTRPKVLSAETEETVDQAIAERRLRAVLRTNAGTSLVAGAIAAIWAGPVADLLGVDAVPVRVAGIGLVVFAAAVLYGATFPPARLKTEAYLTSVGDDMWVLGVSALVLSGAFSVAGTLIMAATVVMVATFGITQWMLARRL